jgi:hypothetical protein
VACSSHIGSSEGTAAIHRQSFAAGRTVFGHRSLDETEFELHIGVSMLMWEE